VVGDIADFTSDIYVDSVSLDRDGEIFEYFTATPNGYPQIQQIPSHRIDSGEKPDGLINGGDYSGYELYDGIVYFPKTSIPVAYSFCDVDGKHSKFVPKKYMLHVFERFWPEQRRGLPLFWHSLNNLRDILQSEEWERLNLLSMSRLNYTVENSNGAPDMDEPGYEPGDCGQLDVEYLQGGTIMYAKAGAGEKITQHQNFRPGNPWHEFYDMQARQCLVGSCLPASLWKPSGQGTAERADIGKAFRFVEDRQSTLEKVAKWRVTKAVAWAMANERIGQSDQWWNWGFTKPPKLTIDDGRSLKEKMNLYDKGLLNATAVMGELSTDFEETIIERVNEEAIRLVAIREANQNYKVEIDPRSIRLLTNNEQAINRMNFLPTATHLKLFAALRGNLWMINQDKAVELAMSVIELSELTKTESYSDMFLSDDYTLRKPLSIDKNKIAHIEIRGAMLLDGSSLNERVGLIIRYSTIIAESLAAVDAGAKGIIYKINSPGGTVSGNIEASKMVLNLQIPTVAYCEGLACSAAYKFAAGTASIIASESALVGNIGTILSWMDYSKFFEKWGIETKALVSEGSTLKSTFHTEPNAEQLDFLQESINESGREFRNHVTIGRGRIGVVLDDEVWKAGWYSGEKAGRLGLIDATGTYEQAYQVLMDLTLGENSINLNT
jgi:protease-4